MTRRRDHNRCRQCRGSLDFDRVLSTRGVTLYRRECRACALYVLTSAVGDVVRVEPVKPGVPDASRA